MSIEFVRVFPVRRSRNQNAIDLAAYLLRTELLDPRTGEWSKDFSDRSPVLYHENLLPKTASDRFIDAQMLWGAAELSERRMDAVVAKHFVVALPIGISASERIDIARAWGFEKFVSKGLGAMLVIHDEEGNPHAHFEVTEREIEGAHFSRLKSQALAPEFRLGYGGKAFILEDQRWSQQWKEFQNEYFTQKNIPQRVDPLHERPLIHLPPKRVLHPFDPRLEENRRRQRQNLEARAQLDQRDDQKLTLLDVVRELSPRFAELQDQANKIRAERLHPAQATMARKKADLERANIQIAERRAELGATRKLLHLQGRFPDWDLLKMESRRGAAEYLTTQRWGIKEKYALDRIEALWQQAKQIIKEVRPQAIAELQNRQRLAQDARVELQKLAEHPVDQQILVQRERQAQVQRQTP